jgi:hypothetical protein
VGKIHKNPDRNNKLERDSKGRFKSEKCLYEDVQLPSVSVPSVWEISNPTTTAGNYPYGNSVTWHSIQYIPVKQKSDHSVFFHVISVLSLIGTAFSLWMSNWQYTALLERFEHLRILLFGHS